MSEPVFHVDVADPSPTVTGSAAILTQSIGQSAVAGIDSVELVEFMMLTLSNAARRCVDAYSRPLATLGARSTLADME